MESIYQVTTVEEISRLWKKNPVSVRRAIDSKRNPLIARKSGNLWLIDWESVVNRWGQPLKHS